MKGHKNQLFIEPTDGGHTCEAVAKFVGDDQTILEQLPFAEGGSGNVIKVDENTIIQTIRAKADRNLSFKIRERPVGDNKLHLVTVSVSSGQLTVMQVLNRRVQKKLVKIRSSAPRGITVDPKS